jgi:hypothetical protein
MNDSTNTNNVQAVSNPASQTLFRFVSLRNPQLAKKEGNTKFIFRTGDVKGIFDALLINEWAQSGKSKIDFLTEKVKSSGFDLSTISRTEAKLHEHFPTLYNYSKTLMANGYLTGDQVNTINTTAIDVSRLWDSLIYQVLVQEDFYVKELITQMLQTIHYAKHYSTLSTEPDARKKKEKQKEITTAKVVVPDSLFIDSAPVEVEATAFTVAYSAVGSNDPINGGDTQNMKKTNAVSESSVASYLPTESALKRQRVALATFKKAQLDELKKDLLKTQKIYNSQYTKAYDLASKDYQSLVKPLYDDYEKQLLQVEATFTEEMTAAAKKLALSQVLKPEVPEFQFEFRKERDTAFLQKKLSESSLRSFVNIIGESVSNDSLAGKLTNGDILKENVVEIGDDQFVLPEDENHSFEEMLEAIDSQLSELNDEIYQNTEVEKQEYVSIGGVLIPVNNKEASITGQNLNYNIKTVTRAPNYWSVMITFQDKSVKILSAEYTAKCKTKDVNDTYLQDSSNGVYILFNNQTFIRPTDVSEGGFIVNGTVKLSDGNYYRFDTTLIRDFTVPLDAAENHYNNRDGYNSSLMLTTNPNDPDNPNEPEEPNDPDTPTNPDTSTPATNNSFVPKGFGIKRLGIADYLKVEQSTHAYVEGEVAGIENIMAREYREKSTRRLRRSEVTETTSSDTEREQLTDTTTASRFEMQSEIAKMQQEATDVGVNASTGYSGAGFNINVAASYANHRSKEESMRQAVSQAQDITARALDRVVTKVHQERIEKIIEEFEENNSHGFDNRKGDKHVVGVYRWVDKLMKNQVWDYGKRLMFEFAVPQPAKIHTLATASLKNGKVIEKPQDPRTSKEFTMSDYTAVATENILKYWISKYKVETDEKPSEQLVISKSLKIVGKSDNTSATIAMHNKYFSISDKMEIPDGYYCSLGYSTAQMMYHMDKNEWAKVVNTIGHISKELSCTATQSNSDGANVVINDKVAHDFGLLKMSKEVSIASMVYDGENEAVSSFSLVCTLSDDAKKQWQQKTFNAIIEAYETALTLYNQEVAEEETKAGNIKETNANFYRQIEQDVLKHNCIAYMVDPKVLGSKLYDKESIENFEVIKNKNLDEYASLSKFMEQAFEWNIMSYDFYPYYWGAKTEWQTLYQSESMDPLFRSFLQSGMARVIVTVRPGFEDAVQFYMATGRLWNGGEVPVIGDPMYLSIVDELKDIKGEAQGKPWITRIPTSLTILQAQNIGLDVKHALPFTTEDPLDFENPEEVITESNFYPSDAQMEAEKGKLVENIEINNDYLQLTNNDNPHQVIAQLSLEDLKEALE